MADVKQLISIAVFLQLDENMGNLRFFRTKRTFLESSENNLFLDANYKDPRIRGVKDSSACFLKSL